MVRKAAAQPPAPLLVRVRFGESEAHAARDGGSERIGERIARHRRECRAVHESAAPLGVGRRPPQAAIGAVHPRDAQCAHERIEERTRHGELGEALRQGAHIEGARTRQREPNEHRDPGRMGERRDRQRAQRPR